jgi:multiple sugar transport system substrate-binding protein
MNGGNVIQLKDGHPTKDVYWFPAYNSTEGVQALEFIKQQANAGIKPGSGDLDGSFAEKKYAVYLGGSWIPSRLSGGNGNNANMTIADIEQNVGFLPVYPVPNKNIQTTSTMMGGWEFAVPQSSKYKDLAWELITIILEPSILAPWLADHAFLPTQRTIGEGPFAKPLNQTIPYYDEMISMISFGRGRPNIAEYPMLADHIQEAIYEVQTGIKEPKKALDDAAIKSAQALGW